MTRRRNDPGIDIFGANEPYPLRGAGMARSMGGPRARRGCLTLVIAGWAVILLVLAMSWASTLFR